MSKTEYFPKHSRTYKIVEHKLVSIPMDTLKTVSDAPIPAVLVARVHIGRRTMVGFHLICGRQVLGKQHNLLAFGHYKEGDYMVQLPIPDLRRVILAENDIRYGLGSLGGLKYALRPNALALHMYLGNGDVDVVDADSGIVYAAILPEVYSPYYQENTGEARSRTSNAIWKEILPGL